MTSLFYIAIEGVIGAGKTNLARLLAERLNAILVLERPEENPFLPDFYRDPQRFAFQTQIHFLFARYKQQQNFPQPEFFHKMVVSDYIFAKDKIFASINLNESELALYNKLISILEPRVKIPDLLIYLQSSPARLLKNIRIRDRQYEREINEEYISELVEAYNHFFLNYKDSPILVVNADNIDFVNNRKHFEELMKALERPIYGLQFYNPAL